MAEATLFAGPSAHGLRHPQLLTHGIELRPPIQRGDVDRLLDAGRAPGVLIVCDGIFESRPAVAHAELCRAIDLGWQVWGVASMGAIRAYELRFEGMRGFGWVYEQFFVHDDFMDDELCLLHLPMQPYTPLSEALVNVRYGLARKGADLGIGAEAQRRIVAAMRELWFGDRTRKRLRELMRAEGIDELAVRGLLAWIGRNRVKTLDLRGLLRARPWMEAASPRQTPSSAGPRTARPTPAG